MAKDKGKKKADEKPAKGKAKKGKEVDEKPSKKGKGGGSGGFAKPSEAKGGGDSWKFEDEDNVGKLFLITPIRKETVKTDDYGETEVVVADIVELNEKKPEKSELHEDAYIFGGWTKGATREHIGKQKVLGRLGQDASKSKAKNGFAWVIEDPSKADIKLATDYVNNNPLIAGGKDGKGKKKN